MSCHERTKGPKDFFRLMKKLISGKTLAELRIDNCVQVTDDSVELVLEICEKLNIFLFHGCPKTTERSLIALQTFLSERKHVKQATWTIY